MNASQWILKRQHELEFESHDLVNIQEWLPGWHDVYVKMKFDKIVYTGRAQDQNKKLAFEKACSEIIERVVVQYASEGTSSGFAVHPIRTQAVLRARNELIERDVFLCNYLTESPLFPLPAGSVQNSKQLIFNRLEKKLMKIGIELKLSVLRSDFNVFTVLCAAFGLGHKPRFGTSIGLGTSASLQDAANKATTECFISILEILCDFEFRTISEKQFRKLKFPDIDHHRMYGLDPKVGSDFKSLFQEESQKISQLKLGIRKARDIEITNIQLPKYFSDCPLQAVRATSPQIQNFFFGLGGSELLNKKRLEQFLRNTNQKTLKVRSKKIHFFA